MSDEQLTFYQGRWLGFNGEVEVYPTDIIPHFHEEHTSKIRNGNRFLATGDSETVV